MPAPRSQDILVQAARLYYLEDKSQGEIAKALGLSRSTVSRILTAAREQGVVEIRIHAPGAVTRVGELELAVQRSYPVKSVTVVARVRNRTPIDVVAEAGARLFEERVAHLSSFGLSWGYTVDRFVDQVQLEPIHRSLRICPLVGGLPSDTGPAGNTSMGMLAARTGATAFRFESPAVVESPRTWAALTSESSISSAIDRAAKVDMAIVGIGAFGQHNSRRVVTAMRLTPQEDRELAAQTPAGDICGRFYDLSGNPLGPPTSQRVIGISLEQLQAVPEVIGLAAGVEKAPGVIGALRTGILDGIVLDEELARVVAGNATS